MKASHKTHHFLPHHGWLWGQIKMTRKCTTPTQHPRGSIQNNSRLDGRKIYWTYLAMGLYQPRSPSVNARLCPKSAQNISPWMGRKTTASTISTCAPKLWPKKSICTTEKQGTAPQQAPHKIYTRGDRNISLLCTSNWWHMLTALSAIATEQATPTATTLKNTNQFLNYAATNNEVVLTYKASNMVLAVHSDVSYLNKPKARSRARGRFFMSSNTTFPANNGAIHNTAQVIKAIMSSTVEAELWALYINTNFVAPIRHTFTEIGHPQPPMPIPTDNSTTFGAVTNKIIPKATKAMDMHYHWLPNREQQQQFWFYWRTGKTNYVNYWTKHHAAIHHKPMQPLFLNTYWEATEKIQGNGECKGWQNTTMVNPSEQKMFVKDLTSCEGVLESPNSLSPTGSKGKTGQGETPEKPIPNSRKRSNNSKNGDRTDMSTGKIPASSGQKKAQEWPLVTISNCWQK